MDEATTTRSVDNGLFWNSSARSAESRATAADNNLLNPNLISVSKPRSVASWTRRGVCNAVIVELKPHPLVFGYKTLLTLT